MSVDKRVAIITGSATGIGAARYAALLKKIEAASLLASASTPEDIAEPIAWLLESARHVTGDVMMVDAGFRLARP